MFIKGGNLSAWIVQGGLAGKEAKGDVALADGTWHHVAAVCNRSTQRLGLYVDGRLDTPDGKPSATNPVDISTIGALTGGQGVSIGGLGGEFPLSGELSEVSITRQALAPSEFSFGDDFSVSEAGYEVAYAPQGEYQSPVCDWGSPVRITSLRTVAELNGGAVSAVIELSNDDFKTIPDSVSVALRDGDAAYSVPSRKRPYAFARLRITLLSGRGGTTSPVVKSFELEGLN
jgi:hypothetical protein